MAQPLLTLPDRISVTLAQDPVINGYVHSQLQRYAPWIKSSGTPFFPGYTDHGEDHLNRVLAAGDWLVADESWPLLTAMDAACIILSVLLHDSAMHLTTDSFRRLLSSEHDNIQFPTLDAATWGELWRAYQLETKHWDSNKWAQLAGPDYGKRLKVTSGQIYSFQLEDIKESELPIIGEFIRRHHPRMAHEFATGKVGDLMFDAPNPLELLDISGLVARSHGLQIRQTFEYLDRFFFGIAEVYNLHPVFLMALLRVADYLDLYAERAPIGLQAVRRIRSTFSIHEWEAHQAIKEIRYDSDSDPERIDVIAVPQSGFAHQRIVNWVTGIQSELDQSWAVLGQIFGRHSRLQKLKLRLRRVATPLANADFARSHNRPYRPPLGKLTLDPDALIRLMIKPLYGDRPEIAVRELVQNSVDAVRLRDAYSDKVGTTISSKYPVLDRMQADVVVSLCKRNSAFTEDVPPEWQYWLEVVDRGIGMTEDVIRDYFLRVGASFRTSPWYDAQLSERERSELHRIGRFGVGVLAGFLCSESMEVMTRHLSSQEAYRFNCSLSSDGIEITTAKTSHIGTSVRLELTQAVHDYLSGKRSSTNPGAENSMLDWYALTIPNVAMIYRCGKDITPITPRYQIPPPSVVSQWRTINIDGTATIQWSFEKDHPHCDLHVNGIFINSLHYQDFRSRAGRQLRAPAVNILDPENVTGLTVTRNFLSGGIPFISELVRDVLLDHIAWLFVQAAVAPNAMSPMGAPGWREYESEGGQGDAFSENSAYLICRQGLVPMSQPNLKMAGVRTLACINFGYKDHRLLLNALSAKVEEALLFFSKFSVYGGFSEPRESVLQRYLLGPIRTSAFEAQRWAVLLHGSAAESLEPWTRKGTTISKYGDFVRIESPGGGLVHPGLEQIFIDSYRMYNRDGESRRLIALILMEAKVAERANNVETALEALWNELRLPPIIPFDQAQRKALVEISGGMLVPYIERHYRSITDRGGKPEDWWD